MHISYISKYKPHPTPDKPSSLKYGIMDRGQNAPKLLCAGGSTTNGIATDLGS
jgi:hypothetical protein